MTIDYRIHAKTFKEAEKIIGHLKKLGFKWRYGPTNGEKLYWRDSKDKTCYSVESGFIIVTHTCHNNKIVTCEDFLKQKTI